MVKPFSLSPRYGSPGDMAMSPEGAYPGRTRTGTLCISLTGCNSFRWKTQPLSGLSGDTKMRSRACASTPT